MVPARRGHRLRSDRDAGPQILQRLPALLAFLLGCVGTWSLHPVQIEIAKRVFSPSAADVAHARRVKEAMGDGTGAVMLDGKMEDDASLKQCLVILELAERLSANDPELAELYASSPSTGEGE